MHYTDSDESWARRMKGLNTFRFRSIHMGALLTLVFAVIGVVTVLGQTSAEADEKKLSAKAAKLVRDQDNALRAWSVVVRVKSESELYLQPDSIQIIKGTLTSYGFKLAITSPPCDKRDRESKECLHRAFEAKVPEERVYVVIGKASSVSHAAKLNEVMGIDVVNEPKLGPLSCLDAALSYVVRDTKSGKELVEDLSTVSLATLYDAFPRLASEKLKDSKFEGVRKRATEVSASALWYPVRIGRSTLGVVVEPAPDGKSCEAKFSHGLSFG